MHDLRPVMETLCVGLIRKKKKEEIRYRGVDSSSAAFQFFYIKLYKS